MSREGPVVYFMLGELRKEILNMKVIIYFNWGRSDSAYDIEQTELERLKKDWLSYLETGKPRGGAYKASVTMVENPSNELLLKFDEVVAIG